MTRTHWLAAGALALVAVPLAAQSVPSFDTGRLSRHVRTISADSYEGRGPATRGEQMTVEYLVREFQAAGLQPGGDLKDGRRQWTQAVPLLKSDLAGTPSISLNLGGQSRSLVQGEHISVMPPVNGQRQVTLTNVPLLFAGYGVTAPERQWDDFKGQDVRGKMLVVLVNDPDFEGGEGSFDGRAMTYYGRWTYKYEEAAKRGAAGVMIVHEDAPASYGWATVKNSFGATNFDIVRANPAAEHTGFESWIQRSVAEDIFRAAGTTFDQAKQAAKRRDFQPVDLKATVTANLTANTEMITSYNVVGILPGTRRPDETVIYTAHHDHLGIGLPDENGDRIYNGAIDNATGIAQLIEQARAFARRPRTERSVVFLAVGAEEKGLLGSEYYVANPLFPLSRTVGVLNTDGMSIWGPARNFSMSGTAKLGLLDMLVAEAQRRGRRFTPDPRVEAGLFFRSDHFPFAKAGVPAVSFRPGNDLVNGGIARGEALTTEYIEKRYHQPDDEFDPSWNFQGMAQDAALLHSVGRALANSRDWPNWSDDSQFRSVRDRTAGDRTAAPPPPRTDVVPTPAEPDPAAGERG